MLEAQQHGMLTLEAYLYAYMYNTLTFVTFGAHT